VRKRRRRKEMKRFRLQETSLLELCNAIQTLKNKDKQNDALKGTPLIKGNVVISRNNNYTHSWNQQKSTSRDDKTAATNLPTIIRGKNIDIPLDMRRRPKKLEELSTQQKNKLKINEKPLIRSKNLSQSLNLSNEHYDSSYKDALNCSIEDLKATKVNYDISISKIHATKLSPIDYKIKQLQIASTSKHPSRSWSYKETKSQPKSWEPMTSRSEHKFTAGITNSYRRLKDDARAWKQIDLSLNNEIPRTPNPSLYSHVDL
jgi:hypothetical protein